MRLSIFICLFGVGLLLLPESINSQNTTQRIPVQKILEQLEKQYGIRFNYDPRILIGESVVNFSEKGTLESQLKRIENQTALEFSKMDASIYAVFKTFTVCGYVLENEQESPLEGATIQAKQSYTTTDEKGYFSIRIRSDVTTLSIRYLGYQTRLWTPTKESSTRCPKVLLSAETEVINPIVLKGYLIQGIDKNLQGTIDVHFSQFTLLPGLIEADILQTLQSLPSIHSTDETISNLSIRGGSHDQNLILWDGIKMYQSGHFFGLISSFNPKITHKATFIQNGTQAGYTDGVSGTIDLKTEDQIAQELSGSFSLNFLSADGFLDLPISEKSSLQLAARKSINELVKTPTYDSYFDRVTQQTELLNTMNNNRISSQDFQFYDTSLRWLYQISENDFLRFNFIDENCRGSGSDRNTP